MEKMNFMRFDYNKLNETSFFRPHVKNKTKWIDIYDISISNFNNTNFTEKEKEMYEIGVPLC